MIGNLGFSSVQCASIPVSVGKLNIMCPYGTIGEFLDEGINQSVKTASNCASNDDNKGCFPDSTLFEDSLKSTVGKES